MARMPTGAVIEKAGKRGTTYGLRFSAYGTRRYETLPPGSTREQADLELANVLADIRRGIWQPANLTEPIIETPTDPTFHEFASAWLHARTAALRPATVSAYRNELVQHLLPFFAQHTLRQITVAEVDRYRDAKLRDGDISGGYINATITRLGAILDVADERGLIERNPVRVNPRNRKVKVSRARRAYLDRPEQIAALLEAASALDAQAADRCDRDTCLRRPLIATLVFAGLRISEALALRWRDVDLAGGRLRVGSAKTDAGVRWVPLMPVLRDELLRRKMTARHAGPDDFAFSTRTGSPLSRDNTRTRVLGKAHELADQALVEADLAPLPERLTQHSMRHTYISLRVALGDDPATISQDAGHADMGVTFRIYTHVMRLQDGDREALQALVSGGQLALNGTSSAAAPVSV